MPVRTIQTSRAQIGEAFRKAEKDKQGRVIKVGDMVETKFRGGVQRGVVEAVIESEQDIEEMGPDLGITIKHPPKVIYTDQHGHRVSHNPGTLSHVEPETEDVG